MYVTYLHKYTLEIFLIIKPLQKFLIYILLIKIRRTVNFTPFINIGENYGALIYLKMCNTRKKSSVTLFEVNR